MHNDYDAADDMEEKYDAGGLRWMSIVVVLLVVFGFFSLAWYAYRVSSSGYDTDELMFVEADTDPYRESPTERGGMEFPHQDKDVYETISSDDEGRRGQPHLQDSTEEPLAQRHAKSEVSGEDGKNTVTEVIEVIGEGAENKTDKTISFMKGAGSEKAAEETAIAATQAHLAAEKAKNLAAEEAAEAKALLKKKQAKEAAKQAAIKKANAKKAAERKAAKAKKATSSGKYQVQLAALRSYGDAQSMWKKLSKKHASLLRGKPHRIVKKVVSGKGTFYRLRVTGLASRRAAKSLCQKLKARGQGCLVP